MRRYPLEKRLVLALTLALASSSLVAASPGAAAPATALAARSSTAPPSLPPTEIVRGPDRKEVILTLEGPASRPALVEALGMLARRRARAVFFLPGSWVAKHRAEALLVLSMGHELGNRGFGNRAFSGMGSAALRRSIRRAEATLKELGVHPSPFVRPPRGARDVDALRAIGRTGYRSVTWTLRPGRGSPRDIQRGVVAGAGAGSIISLDLWRSAHRRALEGIVTGVRARRLAFGGLKSLQAARAVRWDRTLKSGSRGEDVRYLQERLADLTFVPGAPNGVFGESTLHAVYAFEKAHGLGRDGVVAPPDMEAVVAAQPPAAPARDVKDFVDVDLSRQVLFEVRGGRVVQTLPISSANGEKYVSDGEVRTARTPTGSFEILWKIPGWRQSDLGELWYPSYFHSGGYAIHGSPSVPPYPASHGCVRIPMYVAKSFYSRMKIGTKVFVHE